MPIDWEIFYLLKQIFYNESSIVFENKNLQDNQDDKDSGADKTDNGENHDKDSDIK